MTGPRIGLFPEKNNYETTHGSSGLISTNNTDKDEEEDAWRTGESDLHATGVESGSAAAERTSQVEMRILEDILMEDMVCGYEEFQERIKNDRFYLTKRYNTKVGLNELNTDADARRDDIDFLTYSQKVASEYSFREKAEKLLKSINKQPIRVLTGEELHENYARGEEELVPVRPGTFGLRHFFKSSVKGRMLRQPTESDLVNTNGGISASTQVIDLEKNGQRAIDESSNKSNIYESHRKELLPNGIHHPTSRGCLRNALIYLINNPLCESLRKPDRYHIQRKLKVRHLQMIAIGASIGVGLFLTSGNAFAVAGPFGTLLGFSICGTVCLATMLSFTELSTLIPISSGFSGLASRFVEDAFGFALGWSYWLSFTVTFPSQIIASIFMLSYYEKVVATRISTAGLVTVFWLYATAVNLLDVRLFAEVNYISAFVKVLITILAMILMLFLNVRGVDGKSGAIGFRFWNSSSSETELTYGLFRPTFDLHDTGQGSLNGIGGARGRFLAIILVVLISTYSFNGVEMAFVASGEAINPRKTLPSATKRAFTKIVTLYILSITFVGLNMYSGDPRLLRYGVDVPTVVYRNTPGLQWQRDYSCMEQDIMQLHNMENGNRSPWILALQSFGLCSLASAFNGVLVFFGISAASSSLFASSRTLYSMATQQKAPKLFQTCTSYGVPWIAILFSGSFGIIAYISVAESSMANFQTLSSIASGTNAIIWLGLNVSFLRFYYALKRRPDIISRDDPTYPYRSPMQPFLSFYGLIGSGLVVIFMGFTNFLHGFWSTRSFLSSYGGLIFFITSYFAYKLFGASKIQSLEQLDMDTGRREMDRMIWDEHRQYSGSLWERFKYVITWLL
ncbi:AGL171Wp [Eremothecium gossypii ATCC 10895]|uniref:AGL171Wp n=1 Tax=Eremothecium gossypii (strain ATCC 10895 / CBS 109.51 / FGSC 9923 / NRRL Y-1056) TaxID=284811 RepID=Q750W0_EREGS|nr:AGL171Wp [Eremothecium gossypii ATCC 10895]AAS54320.2 AGL171Wp [Eremothecium gossypii ATCC 10895]AEY98646.1 FAGL171Wp [Eremothecium gossypii FDAG1]